MADGVKNYKIVINGIEESISAVDKLVSSLKSLEERINELSSKTINIAAPTVSTTSTGGDTKKSSSTSSLSEEEKLQRQIAQLEEKRVAYQGELYQGYLANKELLKETVNDQKQLAAQERLTAGAYSNTMQGMKQELADIKQAMQTVDLGDGDTFNKMTERANELNEKLKEIEKSYGQFGRNVGNYPDPSQGMNNLIISVNGVEREFSDAREASRALSNELKTMALNGQQDTKEFKELQKTVLSLNSAIKDATVSSTAMDNMLDAMQSLTAIGSMTKGLSSIFGFDTSAIDESIQKLVALQNVMQSLEKIQQQLKTGEFMGGWLQKGNQAVDNLAAKLTGANKAQETLNQTTTAGATAAKGMAAAETAQAAATTTATVATKALSVAMKAIGIGLVISLVSTLITYWEDIYDWFTETIPALKNLGEWFNKLIPILSGVGTALVKWIVGPIKLAANVIAAVINGDFKNLPKIVADSLKDSYNVVENYQKGHNKAVEKQQENHLKKVRDKQLKANEEAEKDAEAKYGKDYKRTQKFYKDQIALLDENLKKTRKGTKQYEEIEKQRQDYQRRLWASEKSERDERNKKRLDASKKNAKAIADAEKDLTQLRINNMKEGLNRTITQLEEERKAKLAKVQADGVMVKERQLEIERFYDNKIAEEKKKHAEEVVKIYDTMYKNILAKQIESQQKLLEANRADKGNDMQILESANSDRLFDQGISSYDRRARGINADYVRQDTDGELNVTDEMVKDVKKLIDLKRKYETFLNSLEAIQKVASSRQIALTDELSQEVIEREEMHLAYLDSTTKAAKKILDDYYKELKEKYTSEEDIAMLEGKLLDESYYNSLDTAFNQRLTLIQRYWADRWSITTDAANKEYDAELKLLNDKQIQEEEVQTQWYNDQFKQLSDWYKKKQDLLEAEAEKEQWTQEEIDKHRNELDAEYNKSATEMYEAHTANLTAIDAEYTVKADTLNRQRNDKLKQENAEYFQETLQEFRDFQTAISNLESKQPVYNSLGLINGKKTNQNNRELLASYETLLKGIKEKRTELNLAFKNGFIDKNTYESSLREMDSFATGVEEKIAEVKSKLNWGNQIAAFLQSAQQYIQAGMDAFSQIMNAVWDAQDAQFDKEQEALDKENEMIQDALNKQDDIIEQHKNKVESIEDELANSRGARRQHLIDQLNAEMEAERRAQKEKERLQKQEELNKKKQEKLELERKKAEYNRNMLQAAVNGAMAITYAMMNTWPVPAIPMMALAASTTATQLAIMAANKPYAKGGILDGGGGVAVGPRHRDGGIPVLGGRASIEGGEFITNRVTTQYNAPLLEYINSKKKRVDVTDLIDFYTGNKVRSNISAIKTKYADGGALPTLPNNLDIRDQISNVIVNQDNRPIYVTVTDIQNKMDDVKYVKTLAGLEG